MQIVEKRDHGTADITELAEPVKNGRHTTSLAMCLALAVGGSQLGIAGKAKAGEYSLPVAGLAALCATNPLLCAGGAAIGTGAFVYCLGGEGDNIIPFPLSNRENNNQRWYSCTGHVLDCGVTGTKKTVGRWHS